MFLEGENEESEASVPSLMDKNVTTQEMMGSMAKNLSPHSGFDPCYFPGRTKRWYSLEFSESPKIVLNLYQTSTRVVFSSMLAFMLLRAVPTNRHFEFILLRLQYIHIVNTVSPKILPSCTGEKENLSCLAVSDDDCHSKQKD